MALTLTLGVSCKKDSNLTPESVSQVEMKKELKATTQSVAVVDPTSPGAFPHNTGVCNCGRTAVCHPAYYELIYYDSSGLGHTDYHEVRPGQTTFPKGAIFHPAQE